VDDEADMPCLGQAGDITRHAHPADVRGVGLDVIERV